MNDEPSVEHRSGYRYFVEITTRWHDNDIYGHVNNVTYYSYFDSAANHFLVVEGGLDLREGRDIGVVVESRCTYCSPLAYPDLLEAGVRADHIGNSSVRYGIAVFRKGANAAAAHGYFVHVFVDRESRRPVPIPAGIRAALGSILVE